MPIVLADHAFNKDGSLRYEENVDLGFRGDTMLVNGAVAPRMRVERRLYRLRLLNASNARSYELRLGRGHTMQQVASDGGLLERVVRALERDAPPRRAGRAAGRLPPVPPGSEIVLANAAGEQTTGAVMRFDVERGGGSEEARIPAGRMRTIDRCRSRARATAGI